MEADSLRQLLGPTLLWVGFNALILVLLAIDLGVFQRHPHAVPLKEATWWTFGWVVLALAFGGVVFHFMGTDDGLAYLTGYLIEWSLSVDNIFVFVLLFSYFAVPPEYQHRILFWGILGALVMRGIMIAAGGFLITQFHWIIYIFGAFLIITGIRLLQHRAHEVHPEKNPVLRWLRQHIRVTDEYEGSDFFVRREVAGRTRAFATPLFVVLVAVETTDVVFALDSIPAIFGITRDTFIVYSSNVFAILGLRSLYFVLAGVVRKFHYLQTGISIVLIFVGMKMLAESIVDVPVAVSLGVVAVVLGASVWASLKFPQSVEEVGERERREAAATGEEGPMPPEPPPEPSAEPPPEPSAEPPPEPPTGSPRDRSARSPRDRSAEPPPEPSAESPSEPQVGSEEATGPI